MPSALKKSLSRTSLGATTPPFAVVAGVDVNGLGVVRSLAKAAIPTLVLDVDLRKPTAMTRFGRKIEVPSLAGPEFTKSLVALSETLQERPVLFLTQEDSVETVVAARDEIARYYRFAMPPADTMRALMDKMKFQELAEALHHPVPRTVRLTRQSNSDAVLTLNFPCVVKPARKSLAYSASFKKAYKLATAQEAIDLWTLMREVVDEVIVQEWIEGGDGDVFFCLQYRRDLGAAPVSFVGRKLRQWPPLVGGTASCVPAPEVKDALIRQTSSFFDDVKFVGLGSMEYKRDIRDKKFYMVEPTAGRTDFQEEIATLNGVNIPAAAYYGELGMTYSGPGRERDDVGWRDADSLANAARAGAEPPQLGSSSQFKFVDSQLRLLDPYPYLYSKLAAIKHRLVSPSRN